MSMCVCGELELERWCLVAVSRESYAEIEVCERGVGAQASG